MSSKSNGVEAPGAETQEVEIPTIEVIERWMNRDIGSSISLLSAIHNDPNIKRLVAEYLQGVLRNKKNVEKADPSQMGLFSNGPKGAA